LNARIISTSSPALRRPGVLWIGIGLLLLLWLTRLPGLVRFPFFIDEGLHVYFSEVTMQRQPFIYASKYYLFSIWWWSLFATPFAAPFWLARTVTLLAVLPGFAAVIGVGRLSAGLWGALFGGLLYLFSTYHFFFERLALADPISASAALVAVYFAYRLTRRIDTRDALLCGFAVFLAVGFKLSAFPYLGVPLAAVIALHPRGATIRERVRWLVVALATEGVLVGGLIVAMIVVHQNPFANAASHAGLGSGVLGSLARIPASAVYMFDNLSAFVGLGGLIVLAGALIVLLIRRRWTLLLVAIPPTLIFLISAIQGSRYYAAPMSIALLCVAVAAADLTRRSRLGHTIALALIAVLALTTWLPFAATMNADPAHLGLPPRDFNEYVTSDASGFGIGTAANALKQNGATRVIGLMANCQTLRYTLLDQITVDCPTINPNGETIPALAKLLDDSRAAGVYAVLETLPYVPNTSPGTVVAIIDDPTGRPRLTIYRLAAQP
jgi:hypothetical protein